MTNTGKLEFMAWNAILFYVDPVYNKERHYFVIPFIADMKFFLCVLQSDFYFNFAWAPNFLMNKNATKTIQKNTILRVFIAKIIHASQLNFSDVLSKNA